MDGSFRRNGFALSVWVGVFLCLPGPSRVVDFGDRRGTERAEARYYMIVDVPIPDNLAIEDGSFVWLPDGRLAVGTRRGEIILVDGVDDPFPQPSYVPFA